MPNDQVFDVLVLGTGAAGLTLALRLADHARVAVVSKAKMNAGATAWAQGGVAAVMSAQDSFESHIEDTLDAGAGLCREDVVRFTVEQGPGAIQWLIDEGVNFSTTKSGPYHLTREGGHSHRRVIHAEDATGKAIQGTLDEKVRAHPNITAFENHIAVDLIKRDNNGAIGPVRGAYIYNLKSRRTEVFAAKVTVIATGGASRVYLYSSNP
ncbi:MAG: FAD-binding protein, partial [Alphaproteobacteria bacterium]|nr:FAD-binding protein [Alphaproteobacteria bacterium]